jgi:hypothetical protein
MSLNFGDPVVNQNYRKCFIEKIKFILFLQQKNIKEIKYYFK